MSDAEKNERKKLPLNRTPFVDGVVSCSCCRLSRSSSRWRAAANLSFSSRSSRASYSSSVSFRSPEGSISSGGGAGFERESSLSCRCLRLCFRLCRLPSSSPSAPGDGERCRRLCRLRLFSPSPSDSSSDSLALTECSFAAKVNLNKRWGPYTFCQNKNTRTWLQRGLFLPQLELAAVEYDHGDRRAVFLVCGYLCDLADHVVEAPDNFAEDDVLP